MSTGCAHEHQRPDLNHAVPASALQLVHPRLEQLEIPRAIHKEGSGPSSLQQDSPSRDASPRPNGHQAEGSDDVGPTGRGSTEGIGIGASRRNTSIRPKDCAGSVVWAKLAKYPWWPAQVLDPGDPWIPSSNETPRRGAIPVRFFGTYDFAWIENQRAVCPYRHNHAEHSSTSRQQTFLDAMAEAEHFEATQELPNGFNEETTPSPQKAPRKGKAGKGRGKKGEQPPVAGKGKKRGNTDEAVVAQRSVKERQDAILQALVLAPPPESPYTHQPCLKGVRKLLEMQKAGLWPAPPPKPQPLLQQPFLQFHGAQMSQPQQAPAVLATQFSFQQPGAQLQHPQYQQQVQQHAGQQAQAQAPWYMQPNFATPSHGLHFFGQHGGVPGALLAAASQQQYNMGHHFPAVDTSQPPKQ